MSKIPVIKGPDRKKPLGYDPKRKKFIFYDDIISGKAKIVFLTELNRDELKKLVIERNRAGPDYTVQVMSGEKYSRDDVIREIMQESDFGRTALEAEVSYLSDLLRQIKENL